MRVDVIHSALGIVLSDKDCRIFPDGALRQELHDAPEREVVVCHVGSPVRIAVSGARLCGVIVGQPDDDESGDSVVGEPVFEVALELLDANLVGNAEVEGGEFAISVFEDRFQHRSIQK